MSKVIRKNLLLLFNCVNYIELKHTIRIMKITTVLTLIAISSLVQPLCIRKMQK